ncbi:MAG: N-formylglutamate amidohydrolase [Alphaproteobacteria bacterium]|nr:N-formylglutamate amidohydrolase [Alphaproteobacteria bacterium]
MAELLAGDEPPPVRVLRPAGASAFLFTADHAGRRIPRALGTLGLDQADLGRHIAWDIGIAGVAELLAEQLDATAVLQRYSRLVIDCNRAPDHATSIPTVSEATPVPGNARLSDLDRLLRRRAVFDPYHAAIAALLDRRAAAGRRTVLVALHSFTPVFKNVARMVQVGVLYHRDARLAAAMLGLLRAEGDLVVGDNEPYAITDTSDYTIPLHGEERGLPHVEIEIRQDLLGDVAAQASWAERLARLLSAADETLRRK